MTPEAVEDWSARAFEAACRAELRALKPGNVHDHAPGHRMTVADFEASAAAAAPELARLGRSLGARVLAATRATAAAVGTNTNLGILLLSAPLALTAERLGGPAPADRFRRELAVVLDATTVADAEAVFHAIVAANPGGLGEAPEHDVSKPAKVTLKAAMAAAADRDSIARQYVTTFADLFEIGLAALAPTSPEASGTAAGTLRVFYAFASKLQDSHILRKFGPAVADEVREEFRLSAGLARNYDLAGLAAFDRRLKARGINPGTSADFTVATLYLAALLSLREFP